MSKIIFYRRKKLGLGSIRGMSHFINTGTDQTPIRKLKMGGAIGERAGFVRNDKIHRMPQFDPESDLLIRWGCTSPTKGIPLSRQLNKSEAISTVGNKSGFRQLCMAHNPDNVPSTVFNLEDAKVIMEYDNPDKKWIVRPTTHSQGRSLWTVDTYEELVAVVEGNCDVLCSGWYMQEFIDKVSEFRVYVMEGRVITVAEKTPENPDAVAWNVAQGGEFNVVRFGEWNVDMCKVAIDYHNQSGLDFSGVDMMVDRDGKPYLIEINSAPSLPAIHGGRFVSYRQKCMAKGFMYIQENGIGSTPAPSEGNDWKDVIHPSISNKWR